MQKKYIFLILPFWFFFGFWVKNFSDFWPKNFKKFSKLTSTCPEDLFVTWTFVLKFWIVLGFLQKLLAWLSKFYLRVQSKNCGKKVFFCFLSRIFSIFEQKFFGLWAKKLQKVSKLPSKCPEEQFVAWIFFGKVLNRFGFSAETFGMVFKILSTCPE